MIIHNGIITLDYDPAKDVLVTSLPDIREFASSEVSFCLGLIIESIRNFDIKYLLLDSSNSVVEVEDEAYKTITKSFALDLMSTRLKKLARVGTKDMKREEKSAKISEELRQEVNFPMEFGNFSTKEEAMEWLLQN
ncbi:hypothetical protein ACFSRY_09485 [Pontibacter locisalis]|uniref:SpoIIAA-like n=1 Tax=Pontibacter locisalis TaxID=1719035 RepID=A0ABW5IKI0_9BACT